MDKLKLMTFKYSTKDKENVEMDSNQDQNVVVNVETSNNYMILESSVWFIYV